MEVERKRGRPRDETIEPRVLDATRELLAERGYAATTVKAISDRSGVPASAVYRRWATRVELVEDAVRPPAPKLPPPTGDLRHDVVRFERAFRRAFGTPAARAAMPALMAEYQSGGVERHPEAFARDSWRPAFYAVLEAAGADMIDPDDAFEVLLGAIFVQTFVPTAAARPHASRRTVDLLCRLLGEH